MEWLSDNWPWVVVGVVLLLLVYRWGRARGRATSSANTRRGAARTRSTLGGSSSRLTGEQEMAVMGFLLSRLSGTLEEVVDSTVGRHYDKTDREKIAIGMIAVMAAEQISLERMTSEPAVFAAVMLTSIATLTKVGEISAH